jgi:adenosylmethionine-8-amino-7-oxononanoate aminotransferase
VRFTGDTIALAPPVITTGDELAKMFDGVRAAIRAVG